MSELKNKIDFVALVTVEMANPNGDPLGGNRPRTNYSGQGEISDVCIKRKIRNRMQDLGAKIFGENAHPLPETESRIQGLFVQEQDDAQNEADA